MAESPVGYKAYEYRRKEKELMGIKDGEVIPYYLEKTKDSVCKTCVFDEKCEGIFKEYVKKGCFEFLPIKDAPGGI